MEREQAEQIMDNLESNRPWHERIPARLGVEPDKKTCGNCYYCYFGKEAPGERYCMLALDAGNAPCIGHSAWAPVRPNKGDTHTMTRSALSSFIAEKCDGIKGLFDYKNQDYGADGDAFANFRKTAQRIVVPFMQKYGVQIDELDAMFLVLMIYQDKHLVALSQTGLSGNEVDERLGDIANYALIARGMLAQKEG